MLLTCEEAKLFFRLHRSLMWYVNERAGIVPDLGTPDDYAALPGEARWQVREKLVADLTLIDQFVAANPFRFTEEELQIVASWRKMVAGSFFVLRELQKHTLFLTTKPPVAYGVLGLSEPIGDVVNKRLPAWVQTTLLPFRDKIVYDGLVSSYNISLGPGIRSSLNESFREAKEQMGVVTSLPIQEKGQSNKQAARKAPSRPKKKPRQESEPQVEVIFNLVERFCRDHLNDEYTLVCKKLTEKLARKRPSPLLRGQPQTWACGIVRTIGWVNYLDDRSNSPHMKLTAIDKAFGVGESTGQGKAKEIRRTLKIRQFDLEWTLPSLMEANPMAWMLEVNGFFMDIRNAPREAQVVAFKKGLIPYIPADQEGTEVGD